jgi:hypothetical protein
VTADGMIFLGLMKTLHIDCDDDCKILWLYLVNWMVNDI